MEERDGNGEKRRMLRKKGKAKKMKEEEIRGEESKKERRKKARPETRQTWSSTTGHTQQCKNGPKKAKRVNALPSN